MMYSPSILILTGYFFSRGLAQTTNSTSNSTTTTLPGIVQLSSDPQFHFTILENLASAPYWGADISEVLTAAVTIQPGDFESYYTSFYNMAIRTYNSAQNMSVKECPISLRETMFRSATYFRSADFYLHGHVSDPRINSLWTQQAAAFDLAISLLPVPGRRVKIPAGNFTVEAIYYQASGSSFPRPTLIVGNGFDGSQEESFHQIGVAALQRGYNVITYEGPGQPTVRRDQNRGFIPEWEKVVTPVVDYLHTLPDVNTSAIGLLGYSFGGWLAARVAAFEHRLAATILLDGIYDFNSLFLPQFPASLTTLFNSGNKTAFDAVMDDYKVSPSVPTQFRWIIDQGTWAWNTTSPYEWLTALEAYTLGNLTSQIKGPIFNGLAQDDSVYKGQVQILQEFLGNKSTFYTFQTADGHGEHSGIGFGVFQNAAVLDWFAVVLAGKIKA